MKHWGVLVLAGIVVLCAVSAVFHGPSRQMVQQKARYSWRWYQGLTGMNEPVISDASDPMEVDDCNARCASNRHSRG